MPEKVKHSDRESSQNPFFYSLKESSFDLKTPLFYAEQKIQEAISRFLQYCDLEVDQSFSTLRIEQEYFLVDRKLALRRPDLLFTGKTVCGANFSEKSQSVSCFKDRISAYFNDCEEQAVRLGFFVKMKQCEKFFAKYVAISAVNKSLDALEHSRLITEMMHQTAAKYNLAVLFHEQPFAGVSGSNQHIYWSISIATGRNLLDPKGSKLIFFTILTAVLKAVHKHASLLLASISSAGKDDYFSEKNISVFLIDLGSQLEKFTYDFLCGRIEEGSWSSDDPLFTDKNSNVFFKFMKDEFAFCVLGSFGCCALPLLVLNAIVAESLQLILDQVESGLKSASSLEQKCRRVFPVLQNILKEIYPFHNNEYLEEDKKGIQIRKSYHAYEAFLTKGALQAFDGILNEEELHSLYGQLTEQYVKTVQSETTILIDLFRTQILPASISFQEIWARSLQATAEIGVPSQTRLLDGLFTFSELLNQAIAAIEAVERIIRQTEDLGWDAKAKVFCELIVPKKEKARILIDRLETMIDDALWPLPKYRELLVL